MKIVVALLVLASAAGAAYYFWQPLASESSASPGVVTDNLFTVVRGDLKITLAENGTIRAKDSVKIRADIDGQAKIVSLIEEGKTVAEGEEIARLDTTELTQQVERLEIDVASTRADRDAALTDKQIQETENQATFQKNDLAVEEKKMELERYLEGDAHQEERKLTIAIEDGEVQFRRAKKKYQDSLTLHEQDFIPKNQLELDEIEMRKAEVQLESGKLELELWKKYTFPMTRTTKQTAVSDAERERQTGAARAQSMLRQKEVRFEQAEKKLKSLEDQLAKRKRELEAMTVKAPCPGIVLYGDPERYWMGEDVKVGGTVWGRNPFLTIPDLRVLQVQLLIHEADINKVKPDQTAYVTMDTYAGLKLNGKVTKIASIARNRGWDEDAAEVKKFEVAITLEGSELTLKPGISAKAEIQIDERNDVIHVPLQAVFVEQGDSFCYVLESGKPARRAVKSGLGNDNFMEITEGLSEGELVLLYNPNLSTPNKGKEDKSEEKKPDEQKKEDDTKPTLTTEEPSSKPAAAGAPGVGGSS